MTPRIYDTADALGYHLAERIASGLRDAQSEGRAFVLGCPGGRSPTPVYAAFAQLMRDARLDCSTLIIAMMDEYLLSGVDGSLSAPSPSAHYSCKGFGERDIRGRINESLPKQLQIPPQNLWMPDPTQPSTYDGRLAAAGGVDLFLLASGAGDGHIAFNPPGTQRDSTTRIVKLADQTRRDNLATFPDFRSVDEVPTHGLTIGTGSIANLSKSVAMIVWGRDKQTAFQRITGASSYDPDWPATIVQECRNAEVHADRAAAGV